MVLLKSGSLVRDSISTRNFSLPGLFLLFSQPIVLSLHRSFYYFRLPFDLFYRVTTFLWAPLIRVGSSPPLHFFFPFVGQHGSLTFCPFVLRFLIQRHFFFLHFIAKADNSKFFSSSSRVPLACPVISLVLVSLLRFILKNAPFSLYLVLQKRLFLFSPFPNVFVFPAYVHLTLNCGIFLDNYEPFPLPSSFFPAKFS